MGNNQTTPNMATAVAAAIGLLFLVLRYAAEAFHLPEFPWAEANLLATTVGVFYGTRVLPPRSPPSAGPTVAVLLLLALAVPNSGCATLNSPSDQRMTLVALNGAIETAGNTLADACGNKQPGGPCLETSYVSTDLRDSIARQLERALDVVLVAQEAVNIGDRSKVGNAIVEVTQILEVVQAALARIRGGES